MTPNASSSLNLSTPEAPNARYLTFFTEVLNRSSLLILPSWARRIPHPGPTSVFLLFNYTLLGAATSCIFLSLSLRLVPSPVGILLILLTIALSVSSCSSSSYSSDALSARWHAAHMAATVLLAIFQGAVALLVFSDTAEFLGKMKSYVREEDGVVIMRMVGGLGVGIFCLEWVVLVLAFVMRFYVHVEGSSRPEVGRAEVRKD